MGYLSPIRLDAPVAPASRRRFVPGSDLTPAAVASSLYQDASHQDISAGGPRISLGKLRCRLFRDPDATSRDALLRFDALLAQPQSTRLLQKHAVLARAVCAARLLAAPAVFASRRGGIAGGRKFEGVRWICAVRDRLLSRPAYSSR